MKKLSVILAVAIIVAAGATNSHAVPSLGVGSSFGYVNATDAYQTHWGSSTPGPSGEDGFVVGPSGSSLHIFTNISSADIYILTTADVGAGNNITFNGGVSIYLNTDTFRSYDPTPYYGANLGKVNGSWTELPFAPGTFYTLDVAVIYSGTLGTDQWIFAAADTNGLAGLQAKNTTAWSDTNGFAGIQETAGEYWVETNSLTGTQPSRTKTGSPGHWVWINSDTKVEYAADTFTTYDHDGSSPKTTSARGWQVPEAGALLLFGTGLVGLIGYRRMRRMQ